MMAMVAAIIFGIALVLDLTSCDAKGPSFFSTLRLKTITPQIRTGSDYANVESWTLHHAFSADAESAVPTSLWLNEIGHAAGAVTLPQVRFDGTPMSNRVVGVGDDASEFRKRRITTIKPETGGSIAVSYTGKECSASNLPAADDSNTKRCYPVFWQTPAQTDPAKHYFHKYLVTQVVVDDGLVTPDLGDERKGGARWSGLMVTDYDYSAGTPAWHWNNSELLKAKHRTWSEWRGYDLVKVRTGDDLDGPRGLTETRYLRGMHGDRKADGTTKNVTVSIEGVAVADAERFAGYAWQTSTLDGAAVVTRTTNTPWLSAATATDGDGDSAYLMGSKRSDSYTPLSGGRPDRHTRVDTTLDPTYAIPTAVSDHGDITLSTDDRCTTTEYVHNTGAWLIGLEKQSTTVAKLCGQAASLPADHIAGARTYYDDETTFGATPTKGLVVRTREIDSYSGTTPVYIDTATSAYDDRGRITQACDALTRCATTAYTETDGLTTLTTQTSPDPDGSGSAEKLVTKTTLDPAFGVPTKVEDPNNRVTEASYDSMGRLSKLWLPGRAKATQSPNLTYEYQVTDTGVNAVTSHKLVSDGASYATSVALMDGLLRPVQTQTDAMDQRRLLDPSLDQTVYIGTHYDSRGQAAKTWTNEYEDTVAPSTTLRYLTTDPSYRSLTTARYDGAGRKTIEAFYSTYVNNGQTPKWTITTSYGGDWVEVDPPRGSTATRTVSEARGLTTTLRQYLTDTPGTSYQDTGYGYDKAGRLASVTDPANNTWSYSYDLRGRQTVQNDPDAGTTTMSYDAAGQLTSRTDARGKALFYDYDQLGRKTATRTGSATGPKIAEWTFDSITGGKGLLSSSKRIDNGNSYTSEVTGYDTAGRPTGTTVTIPAAEGALAGTYSTTSTYNPDGTVATQALPAAGGLPAETLRYAYDGLGRPSRLAGQGAYVDATRYTPFGEVSQVVLGNVLGNFAWRGYQYEEDTRRLKTATLDVEDIAGKVANTSYGYDPAGNVTSITEAPGVAPYNTRDAEIQCFTYDGLRRLTEAWTPTGGDCAAAPSVSALGGPAPYWTSWTFDAVGNRKTQTAHASGGDSVTAYTHPAAGQPQPHTLTQAVTTGPGAGTTSWQYDAAGNTTSRNRSGSTAETFTWDDEGRVKTYAKGTDTGSYLYDADGNRLIKRENGTSTLYLGSTELKATGTTVTGTRYYGLGDTAVAVRTTDSTGNRTGLAPVSVLISDHHGTGQIALSDGRDKAADQTVEGTVRRFDPYGNPRGTTVSDPTTGMTWPGEHGNLDKPTDTLTGYTRFGARGYDPIIGRFTSIDPIMDLADPEQCTATPTATTAQSRWPTRAAYVPSTSAATAPCAPMAPSLTATTAVATAGPLASRQVWRTKVRPNPARSERPPSPPRTPSSTPRRTTRRCGNSRPSTGTQSARPTTERTGHRSTAPWESREAPPRAPARLGTSRSLTTSPGFSATTATSTAVGPRPASSPRLPWPEEQG